MHIISRFILLSCLFLLVGCALGYGDGAPDKELTPAEELTGIDADTFVDKDTHMREFHKGKIAEQEEVIRNNKKEIEKLNQPDPSSDWVKRAHDAAKKDRLEQEIIQAKKSKRNWEKVQQDYIRKQQGGEGGSGGGGGGGGCSH